MQCLFRKRTLSTLAIGITIVGMTVGIWGCSTSESLTRQIVDERYQAIGLEVTYRDGSHEYDHPALLPPEHIHDILSTIQAFPASMIPRVLKGLHQPSPAFSEEQLNFFSKYLSQALLQATPLETATFFWVHSRENGLFEITSGGMYVEGETLHVLLPNYRHTVSSHTLLDSLKQTPLFPREDPLYHLEAKAPARPQETRATATLWAPTGYHFLFPLHADMDDHQTTEGSRSDTRDRHEQATVKKRLERIQALHQDGLITDQEYKEKKQEILDGL